MAKKKIKKAKKLSAQQKVMQAEDAELERISLAVVTEQPELDDKPPLAPVRRRHLAGRLLIGLCFASLLVLAGLVAWHYSAGRLKISLKVFASAAPGIHVESQTYQSNHFYGSLTYPLTENVDINQSARLIAEAYFATCKNAALRSKQNVLRQCTIGTKVHLATTDYLQLEFTAIAASDNQPPTIKRSALLFDRKTGKQIAISNLFKPSDEYVKQLSKVSLKALKQRFAKEYASNSSLQTAIALATQPAAVHFKDFLLLGDERLAIIFTLPQEFGGPMHVIIAPDKLYDLFERNTLQAFFPQLKANVETERRLAEEARRKAEETEANRRKTRQLVAPNRANIDCSKMKCIALTYDDGPGGYTSQLLDILQSRQAVATFFVLGSRANAHGGILRRAVELRNEVANHSWGHPNLTRLDNAAIVWQVDQTSQAIFNATGAYPKLFRPPEGAFDSRVIAQVGLPLALWSIDTNDWRDRNTDSLYQQVLESARPGAVALMHDIYAPAVEAAPRLIDELQRQGYVLVTMSELFGVNKDNLGQFSGQVLRSR